MLREREDVADAAEVQTIGVVRTDASGTASRS